MNQDLARLSVSELLRLFADVMEELKKKEVVRSRNNPVADYAEWLAIEAFNLKRQRKSNKGFDAVDPSDGIKYEIKGRRLENRSSSRQLSVIRKLEHKRFDFLIGILFDNDFSIHKAYKIPHHIISNYSRYREYVNGHILTLQGAILSAEGVERIDSRLREHVQ